MSRCVYVCVSLSYLVLTKNMCIFSYNNVVCIVCVRRLVHSLCQATSLHHQPYVARAVLLASDKLMKEDRNKCLLYTAKVCVVCVCYMF